MKRVEIWTVYGDHLVFHNVMLAGPSEGEKFFCIRRDDRTDYIPAYDIKKVQVVDLDNRERYRSDFGPIKKPKKKTMTSRSAHNVRGL